MANIGSNDIYFYDLSEENNQNQIEETYIVTTKARSDDVKIGFARFAHASIYKILYPMFSSRIGEIITRADNTLDKIEDGFFVYLKLNGQRVLYNDYVELGKKLPSTCIKQDDSDLKTYIYLPDAKGRVLKGIEENQALLDEEEDCIKIHSHGMQHNHGMGHNHGMQHSHRAPWHSVCDPSTPSNAEGSEWVLHYGKNGSGCWYKWGTQENTYGSRDVTDWSRANTDNSRNATDNTGESHNKMKNIAVNFYIIAKVTFKNGD